MNDFLEYKCALFIMLDSLATDFFAFDFQTKVHEKNDLLDADIGEERFIFVVGFDLPAVKY